MKKILVLCFSASGTTLKAGRRLAKELNADFEELKPVEAYTSNDLNWNDAHSRSSIEMNDVHSRPKMLPLTSDLRNYDTLFLGFPIWWGVEPRIIDTFLDTLKDTNIRIIPFATSGGSGIGYCLDNLHKNYPDLNIGEGILLNRFPSSQVLEELLGE